MARIAADLSQLDIANLHYALLGLCERDEKASQRSGRDSEVIARAHRDGWQQVARAIEGGLREIARAVEKANRH